MGEHGAEIGRRRGGMALWAGGAEALWAGGPVVPSLTSAETSGASEYPSSWKVNIEPAEESCRRSGGTAATMTPEAEGIIAPPKRRVTKMKKTVRTNDAYVSSRYEGMITHRTAVNVPARGSVNIGARRDPRRHAAAQRASMRQVAIHGWGGGGAPQPDARAPKMEQHLSVRARPAAPW